jgi:membrane associated rhomboid family serine protease
MIYMQVDVPMERLPWANWVLMAGTAVISISLMVQDAKAERQVAAQITIGPQLQKQLANPKLTEQQKQAILENQLAQQFADLDEPNLPSDKYALHLIGEGFHIWQLVTHLFVHAGIWHLFGNLLFLFCFGNAVDAKLGHLPFLGLYLALGVFAGLAWLLLGTSAAVGASGAIMGITGVFLVLYPLNEVAVWDLFWMWMTGDALRIPSWVFIALYMALDLYGTLAQHEGVGYVAHLAGECAGVGIASGLVLAGWVRSGRGERNLMELWGWVEERKPRKRRRKPRPQVPPANSDRESYP